MKTTAIRYNIFILTLICGFGLQLSLKAQTNEYGLIGHQEFLSYYNPAVPNSGTHATLGFFHRNQWQGIGPTNNILSFERPFLESRKSFSPVAWGVFVQQEEFSVFKLSGIQGMYTGQLKANKYEVLKFGINLGASVTRLNTDGFDVLELSDPNLTIDDEFTLSSRLGISYQRKKMELGLASGFTNFNNYTDLHAFFKRSFDLSNPNYIITPLVVARTSEKFSVQLEGQVRLQVKKFINVTAGYRQNFGAVFQLGFILGGGQYKGSFGYEIPNNETQEFGSSQEVVLAINWETLASKNRTKAIADKKQRDSIRFARRDSIRVARLLLQEQRKATSDSLASLNAATDSLAHVMAATDSLGSDVDVIAFEEISVFRNAVHDNTHVIMDHIGFEKGQDIISADSFEQLDQLAKYLKHHHHYRIEVQGHSDDIGDYEDNVDLSERRALAVTNYILSRGVSRERVDLRGYGPDRPLVPNDSEENRSLNRRVEIVFHTINKHQKQ